MRYVVGVDGGNSKTLALLVDEVGRCRGVGLAGGGNFQGGRGVPAARAEVQQSIERALAQAGVAADDVAAAYFGMAGADRPSDFEIVRGLLEPIVPCESWGFENDATIGIWAGTGDGVGVGVICGSGTNVIGLNAEGKRVQVGGMGYLFGDGAGGGHIGRLGFRAAMRGHEGRGEESMLYGMLCEFYGVEDLLDLKDWEYAGKSLRLNDLAPLVFEAAAKGDRPAQQVLTEVGTELGVSANAAIAKLFSPDESVKVVAIGSVFQNATYPLMYDTFVETMRKRYPAVQPRILDCEPVFGAVFAAAHMAGIKVDEEFKATLSDTFPGRDAAQRN